ncbi:Metallo-dependent phosphatase, partial [Tilletiaria anomala UBC 951]
DVIKVMITTDNHIGYMENDPVRGQDAINSFREALEIAKEEQVDMILLGGDLFHDNKPSRNTLHQVMAALREHTLGDNPLPLEYISDPFDNALGNYSFGAVNYEDGNFNVAIPVFSIHGNHDDPQGLGPDGALSALDILATAGLINYFGKTNLVVGRNGPQNSSDRDIKIRPALLQKGTTKLALYGLGNLHDERLAMELRMRRVRMYQPVEDRDEYFHMLALHQNRVGHNPKAVVPEGIFDDSLHLLIWGHEHEERADPEQVPDKPYRICQPGSTVVTALSKGEDKPKCVVILKIHGRDYEVTKRELKSVRPFIIEDLDLEQEICERGIARLDNDKSKFEIQRMLENKITGLIDRARDQWKAKYEHLPQEHVPDMPLPLIRLRVNYEKHEVGNLARFGQKFVGQVANPKDLLGFNKKRAAIRRARELAYLGDHPEFVDVDVDMDDMVVSERLQKLDLGKIVGEVIRNQELECLPGATLDEAVMQFVEKDS